MNIACLGWGSLIWDPRELPFCGRWQPDGPYLPIEFARESGGPRITLVIADVEQQVPSLWTLMAVATLEEARLALGRREAVADQHIPYAVGCWEKRTDKVYGAGGEKIRAWAQQQGLDAVVWTNLWCGFKHARQQMPTYRQVLSFLNKIPPQQRHAAEQYVRRTPRQVDTVFRRKLQRDLGWSPLPG